MHKYLWLVLGLMCEAQASQIQQIIPAPLAKNIRNCINKDDVEGLRKLHEEEQFPINGICGNESIYFDYCKEATFPVTPLFYAASERKLLTIKALVDLNADINCNTMINNQKNYPLLVAYLNGFLYGYSLNGKEHNLPVERRKILKPITQLFLRDAISKEHLKQAFMCLKNDWADPEKRYKSVTDDLLSLVVNFGKIRKLRNLKLPQKAVFSYTGSEKLSKDIGKEISKYL